MLISQIGDKEYNALNVLKFFVLHCLCQSLHAEQNVFHIYLSSKHLLLVRCLLTLLDNGFHFLIEYGVNLQWSTVLAQILDQISQRTSCLKQVIEIGVLFRLLVEEQKCLFIHLRPFDDYLEQSRQHILKLAHLGLRIARVSDGPEQIAPKRFLYPAIGLFHLENGQQYLNYRTSLLNYLVNVTPCQFDENLCKLVGSL